MQNTSEPSFLIATDEAFGHYLITDAQGAETWTVEVDDGTKVFRPELERGWISPYLKLKEGHAGWFVGLALSPRRTVQIFSSPGGQPLYTLQVLGRRIRLL